MSRPSQWTEIYSQTRTSLSTGSPGSAKITTGWPVGDAILKGIMCHIRSKVSASTALVTRGRGIFLNGVTLKTDKHKTVIDDIDGIMFQQLSHFILPRGAGHRIVGDTADSDHFFYLPLFDHLAARPEDTGLDLLRVSNVELRFDYGDAGDIETTGGTTLDNLDEDVSAEIDPGPVDVKNYGPAFMPHLAVLKEPINQTVVAYRIALPYGDRIYKGILISQRDATALGEVNDTEIGVNTTDKVSLLVNGFRWVDELRWSHLVNLNVQRYRSYATGRGYAYLDFMPHKTGGSRLSHALGVIDANQGRVDLKLDVTNVSDQIWVGLNSVMPIPFAAQRPSPEPQK